MPAPKCDSSVMPIILKNALERAIDVHVGKALRARRMEMAQSQLQLAESVLRSFQQVQKYERGINRVPASLLYLFAKAQNGEVGFYFDGFVQPAQVKDENVASARLLVARKVK